MIKTLLNAMDIVVYDMPPQTSVMKFFKKKNSHIKLVHDGQVIMRETKGDTFCVTPQKMHIQSTNDNIEEKKIELMAAVIKDIEFARKITRKRKVGILIENNIHINQEDRWDQPRHRVYLTISYMVITGLGEY